MYPVNEHSKVVSCAEFVESLHLRLPLPHAIAYNDTLSGEECVGLQALQRSDNLLEVRITSVALAGVIHGHHKRAEERKNVTRLKRGGRETTTQSR